MMAQKYMITETEGNTHHDNIGILIQKKKRHGETISKPIGKSTPSEHFRHIFPGQQHSFEHVMHYGFH